MGTQLQPGLYDCYANAAPDEPFFVVVDIDEFTLGHDSFHVGYTSPSGSAAFLDGELVHNTITGATARIISHSGGAQIDIDDATGPFNVGDAIVGRTSDATGTITSVMTWNYES